MPSDVPDGKDYRPFPSSLKVLLKSGDLNNPENQTDRDHLARFCLRKGIFLGSHLDIASASSSIKFIYKIKSHLQSLIYHKN